MNRSVHILFLTTILFLFMLMGIKPVTASENDSYTHRFDPLPDLTEFLNQKVNEFLEKAVEKANQQARDNFRVKENFFNSNEAQASEQQNEIDCCNPYVLYDQIRIQLARPLVGQLESLVNNLPDDESRKVTFEESIYKDFTIIETPTFSSMKKMGALINIQNHIIGADKFGHFFSEGWSYFSLAYSDEVHIEAALLFGEMSESIFFGALVTGVYSYADLTANFNGMRFWNKILGLNPDVLHPQKKTKPYIRCINNQWEIVNKFDWRDYVDSGWDEGINCNSFRNDTLLQKVTSQIDLISKTIHKDCSCPIDNGDKVRLMEKYGQYSDHLLNLKGHTVLTENLQPQILLDKYWSSRLKNAKPTWKIDVFTLIEKQLKELQDNEYYKKLFQPPSAN